MKFKLKPHFADEFYRKTDWSPYSIFAKASDLGQSVQRSPAAHTYCPQQPPVHNCIKLPTNTWNHVIYVIYRVFWLDTTNQGLSSLAETRADRSRLAEGCAHDSEHNRPLWRAQEQLKNLQTACTVPKLCLASKPGSRWPKGGEHDDRHWSGIIMLTFGSIGE